MKTFLVTHTTVETFEVQAESKEEAVETTEHQRQKKNRQINFSVAEKLATPEYRVVVAEISDCEFGYTVERRAIAYGNWESVDSCWGFLGNDLAYMMSQASDVIPEGVTAKVVGGPYDLDDFVDGNMKESK